MTVKEIAEDERGMAETQLEIAERRKDDEGFAYDTALRRAGEHMQIAHWLDLLAKLGDAVSEWDNKLCESEDTMWDLMLEIGREVYESE